MLMKYSAQQLEAVATKLRQLPPVQDAKTHSKRDAIRVLATEIRALRDRGYTLDQIAEALGKNGLEISTPTLKNYLGRAKAKASKAPRKRRDKPASEAPRPQSAASFDAKPDTRDI